MKFIFWDWNDTLLCNGSFCLDFYIKLFETRNNLQFDAFNHEQKERFIAYVKSQKVFIPYAWHVVKAFNLLGYKQFIVTQSQLSTIELYLQNAPFNGFEMILTPSLAEPKPSAALFHYAASIYDIKCADAFMIGDNLDDVDSNFAANAGIKFFQVNMKDLSTYAALLDL